MTVTVMTMMSLSGPWKNTAGRMKTLVTTMRQIGKQATEWLDQSADYVRHFEYERVDADFRDYVKKSPGRSLLIAGGIGLIIGVILQLR